MRNEKALQSHNRVKIRLPPGCVGWGERFIKGLMQPEETMESIHTLEARGNVMLEAMRDYFKLSPAIMRREIQAMHRATQQILAEKGISYTELRSALVPSIDKHEAGFLFDSKCIESPWYGLEVARAILPLFEKRASQSVLCGDLIGDDQNFIYEMLKDYLVLSRSFEFVPGSALHCVYINNLSDASLQRFHTELSKYEPYIGFIPGTYASRAKTYLSTILAHIFLKFRNKVIMGHEDDRSNEENVNVIGFPFEEYGYKVVSLQSSYFGLFLSYKIERPVYEGFQVDTQMALMAMSDHLVLLEECEVLVEEAKHAYLTLEKAGKLEKAGVASLGRDDLAALIKSKIAASYIYSLSYLPEHNVTKFNLMLEIPRVDGGYPTRLLAALEYLPSKKVLRVITLY
jgi:hypothetical protein